MAGWDIYANPLTPLPTCNEVKDISAWTWTGLRHLIITNTMQQNQYFLTFEAMSKEAILFVSCCAPGWHKKISSTIPQQTYCKEFQPSHMGRLYIYIYIYAPLNSASPGGKHVREDAFKWIWPQPSSQCPRFEPSQLKPQPWWTRKESSSLGPNLIPDLQNP